MALRRLINIEDESLKRWKDERENSDGEGRTENLFVVRGWL